MARSKRKTSVIRTSVSMIIPAQQGLPSYTYSLSSFDLLFASLPFYMQTLYLFRTKKADTEDLDFVQKVKQSLSNVLSLYPVFAGRLKKNDGTGRLEVDVNGEGVSFVEAETDVSLDEWPDLYEYCNNNSLDDQLYPEDLYITDIFTAPLIQLQLTKFKCGGIAFGLNSLHVVADGQVIIQFMKTWGDFHRGEVDTSTLSPLSKPHDDSILICPRSPPSVSIPSADEVLSACIPNEVPAEDPAQSIPPPAAASNRFRNARFRIQGERVRKCKEAVQNGPFSYGSGLSSFEALSGLLWAIVSRARATSAELEDTSCSRPRTTFVVSMSVRERLIPPQLQPIGGLYKVMGNAIYLNHATASVNEMQTNHFSFAARLIHETVRKVSPEFAQDIMDWMELRLRDSKPLGYSFETSDGRGTKITNTSFTNFPVYEIDFGRKLDYFDVSILPEDAPTDGPILYILPSPPGAADSKQSRIVKLRLREDQLENVLRDPEFLLYFDAHSAESCVNSRFP